MNKEVLLLKLINKIDEQREKEISIFDYTMLLMVFLKNILAITVLNDGPGISYNLSVGV